MKRSKSPQTIANYKHLSNLVRFKTRIEAQQLADSFSKFYSFNLKQLWRWINSVKGYRRPLPPLQGDTLIVDNDAKATTVFSISVYSGEIVRFELSTILNCYPALCY